MKYSINIVIEKKGLSIPVEIYRDDKDMKLRRIVIEDPSLRNLQFPFTLVQTAAEYLCDEYEIDLEYATSLLDEICKVSLGEVGEGEVKKKDFDHISSEADWRDKPNAKEAGTKITSKAETTTFELAGHQVTKTVRTKTVEGDPVKVEELELDSIYKLTVLQYSKKTRVCKLYRNVVEEGEVKEVILVDGVSLQDAILKYASISGLSKKQADDHIKAKRGLIKERASVRRARSLSQAKQDDMLSVMRKRKLQTEADSV